MNKTDLIHKISKEKKITLDKSKELVNAVFDEILDSLANGESVSISGFGSFNISVLDGRKGKVPKSSKTYTSKAKYVVRFKPAKGTKAAIAENPIK